MAAPEPQPRAREKRGSLRLAGALLTVLALALFAAWKWRARQAPPPADDDPRWTFATPYRNVRPDVKYVGDEACARCHAEQSETYARHPMGRSLALVSLAAPVERYGPGARNPFEKSGSQFLVSRHGDRVLHREIRRDPQGRTVTELEAEVRFAVGSGTRGRTYLIDRDGYLFQSPISWFGREEFWDTTPGMQAAEHFDRPASAQCLFCHCNRAEPVEDTVNRYRPPIFHGHAIGCERCHGPGQLHVERQQGGERYTGPDNTIVNPRRLEPALREAVCQQCHLQGESRVLRRNRQPFDFRPGLPLHRFLSVFVRHPGWNDRPAAAGHTEQMYQSRCFQQSKGALGCISCHDPHKLPAAEERVAYYRGRCLTCHQDTSCALPAAARRETNRADSCIDCHMPRTNSQIVHLAVTDHRIVRSAAHAPFTTAPPGLPPLGEAPLLHFHRDLEGAPDAGVSRDLGLALAELGRTSPGLARRVGPLALPLLEEAVQRAPEDVPAWEARGTTLWLLGRQAEALTAFETALAKAPRREEALTYAAYLAGADGRADTAVGYWRRAIALNPWCSQYRYRLARLLTELERWPEAVAEGEAAVRLNPFSEDVRLLLIRGYLNTGKKDRANAELDTLLRMKPADAEALRRWFAGQAR
jgi:hypothetical protein